MGKWEKVGPNITRRRGPDGDAYLVRVSRKGHSVSGTFDSFREAEQFRNRTTAEIDGGQFVDKTRERSITLADLLTRYAEEVSPTKKGQEQEIIRLEAWKREDFAKLAPTAISPQNHIIRWRDNRVKEGKAPSTINNALNLLSSVFRHAIGEWGYNMTNPVTGIKRVPPKAPRLVHMSPADRGLLLDACKSGPPWLLPMVLVALETAMRQGEIRSMKWEYVHPTHIHLPMTKNLTARDVPLTLEAYEILQGLAGDDDKPKGYVIQNRGYEISLYDVQNAYRKAIKLATTKGLSQHYTFHDLRHVAITELKQDHADAFDLAKTTGHKTINLLHQVYYNPTPEDRAKEIRRRRAERLKREPEKSG